MKQAFSSGLSIEIERNRSSEAWADIALLIGGVTLARAVQDQDLANEITDAVLSAIHPGSDESG
ncbi:MAG: hypothetical protein ABW104_18930 [Candidatus Thiodiazotropha sp. 6PLUC2]